MPDQKKPSDYMKRQVGALVRACREAKQMTVADLALLAEVPEVIVIKVESGQRGIGSGMLFRVADNVGFDPTTKTRVDTLLCGIKAARTANRRLEHSRHNESPRRQTQLPRFR